MKSTHYPTRVVSRAEMNYVFLRSCSHVDLSLSFPVDALVLSILVVFS